MNEWIFKRLVACYYIHWYRNYEDSLLRGPSQITIARVRKILGSKGDYYSYNSVLIKKVIRGIE